MSLCLTMNLQGLVFTPNPARADFEIGDVHLSPDYCRGVLRRDVPDALRGNFEKELAESEAFSERQAEWDIEFDTFWISTEHGFSEPFERVDSAHPVKSTSANLFRQHCLVKLDRLDGLAQSRLDANPA